MEITDIEAKKFYADMILGPAGFNKSSHSVPKIK